MRFGFASVVLVLIAFGFIGLGSISMAESGSLSPGNLVEEGDKLPDLVRAANGKKEGPKGDGGHGKIVQPDVCAAAKLRGGPKGGGRDKEDVGKVAVGNSADVDAKATCPPPKDLPPAAKGKGTKARDKVLTN